MADVRVLYGGNLCYEARGLLDRGSTCCCEMNMGSRDEGLLGGMGVWMDGDDGLMGVI